MESDEEYVNYNVEESQQKVTTNKYEDNKSQRSRRIKTQNQHNNQTRDPPSKKRVQSLYDENHYALPIGAIEEDPPETQGDDSDQKNNQKDNQKNNQKNNQKYNQKYKPMWPIFKWLLIFIGCLIVIIAGALALYATSATTDSTHETKSVKEGRTFKLFVDLGRMITYCDVKPPFTDEHLSHSKIEGMSKTSKHEIDNERAKMDVNGDHCEVTISNATKKDSGKWDFQVSSAKDTRQFGQRHNLHHTTHYIFLVSVDQILKETEITTIAVDDDTSAIGKCWDSRLSNTASRLDMERNGWSFVNVGRLVVTRSGMHDEKCGKNSWYGWKTPGSKDPASVAALFVGNGSAMLDFGNCHISGTIDVFLKNATNEVATKVGTASAMESSRKVSFDFHEGMILNITTNDGIIKMNKLSVSCTEHCCSDIRIGSKDLEAAKLPRSMGYYRKNKNNLNGKPIWKKGENSFLFSDRNGFWSVGNDYNTTSGAIYHPTCKTDCPELCSDDWSYTNPGWATNQTVDISCTRCPEIKGITNNLDIASTGSTDAGGVLVWTDQNYYFNTLPTYLKNANFFKIPWRVNHGNKFEITIYRPSTIFLVWHSISYLNINNGLENDGWKRFSDSIATSWSSLNTVYMKTFQNIGQTKIPLRFTSSYYKYGNRWYGSIFIRDGAQAQYGGHKLCHENCNPCTKGTCYCSISQLTNQCSGQCGCGNYQCEKCNCTAAPACQIF